MFGMLRYNMIKQMSYKKISTQRMFAYKQIFMVTSIINNFFQGQRISKHIDELPGTDKEGSFCTWARKYETSHFAEGRRFGLGY